MHRPCHPIVVTLALLLSLTLAACQQKREVSPVLLRVDGRTVTLSEFHQEFARTLPADQKLSAEEKGELERSYLVQMIDRELALAEALRLNLIVTPEELEISLQEHRRDYPDREFEGMLKERGITLEAWKQDLERGLLMEKVVRKTVNTGSEVEEKTLREYYDKNREEFDRPLQVRARQIVVSSPEEGERVLGLLRTGESFEEMARRVSLSPDSEEGGDLGFFGRGDMPPEFEKAVFSLGVGELSPLVKTEYGYHIFRVESRREAVRLTFEQVREDILSRLRDEQEEQVYQEWLRGLRSKAIIEVDWSLL